MWTLWFVMNDDRGGGGAVTDRCAQPSLEVLVPTALELGNRHAVDCVAVNASHNAPVLVENRLWT